MRKIDKNYILFGYEKHGDYEGCFICNNEKKLYFRISRIMIEIILGMGYEEHQIYKSMKKNAELILEEIPKGKVITLLTKSDIKGFDKELSIDFFMSNKFHEIWPIFINKVENIDRDKYEAINGPIKTPQCSKCGYLVIDKDGKKSCNNPDDIFSKYREGNKILFIRTNYLKIIEKMDNEISTFENMTSCPLTKEEIEYYIER